MKVDLPAFGMPSRPDVGQHLQLELELARSRPASPRVNWRGARFMLDLKCRLPRPPLPPCGEQRALAVVREVGDRLRRVSESLTTVPTGTRSTMSARRLAVAVRAAAVLAVPRAMDARVAIVDQRVDVAVGDRVDAAAAAAVAAVGPAARDELLAPEARAAVPAVAGVDFDHGFVDEFHATGERVEPETKKPCPSTGLLGGSRVAFRRERRSPSCGLPGPCCANWTRPVTFANSVWSRPMPTLSPGMHLGAALAHDDAAGGHELAAVALDAEALRLGIAAVARAAACFLVCHGLFLALPVGDLSCRDAEDFDLGVVLPVALGLAVVLAAAHLEYAHLLAAPVADHLGRDLRRR